MKPSYPIGNVPPRKPDHSTLWIAVTALLAGSLLLLAGIGIGHLIQWWRFH